METTEPTPEQEAALTAACDDLTADLHTLISVLDNSTPANLWSNLQTARNQSSHLTQDSNYDDRFTLHFWKVFAALDAIKAAQDEAAEAAFFACHPAD